MLISVPVKIKNAKIRLKYQNAVKVLAIKLAQSMKVIEYGEQVPLHDRAGSSVLRSENQERLAM